MTLMAWKGLGGDTHIWWSSFDGQGWSPQQVLDDRRTDSGPALAAGNNAAYMAWKGLGDDTHIWWSSFDGQGWSPQQVLDDRRTDSGPALA